MPDRWTASFAMNFGTFWSCIPFHSRGMSVAIEKNTLLTSAVRLDY
jgi:hypothetical protein